MQPDTTQVNRFHSRPLDLRKPNAKTGALQMLKLINRGFALGPPECLFNRHNAKWPYSDQTRLQRDQLVSKFCNVYPWSRQVLSTSPRYCSEFSGAIICQKYDVSILHINYPDGLCEDIKI